MKSYVGFINNEPVCFVGINKFPHPINKNIYKIGRVVTLPHWQGYGLGMKMTEEIAKDYYNECDLRITTTLPIVHSYLWKNKDKWRLTFQGVRLSTDSGKNATMSKNNRECYLETYQFVNDCYKDTPISRARVSKEKRKEYK